MKKRIIFVGIHNKPNMTALDSRTKTGQIIDKIIEQIPAECVKSNLLYIDYFNKDRSFHLHSFFEWKGRHKPLQNDVVILLGKFVQKNFYNIDCNIVNLNHPSYAIRTNTKEQYIIDAVNKIKNYCT